MAPALQFHVREWIAIRSEKFAASTARSPRPSAPAPRAICGAVALWARRDRHRGRGDQGAAGDTRPRLRLYESAAAVADSGCGVGRVIVRSEAARRSRAVRRATF